MSLRNCSLRRPPASTQSAMKVSPWDSTLSCHFLFLRVVPWSLAAPGVLAALLQHPTSQGFVVRISVIMISSYGDKGPFGVLLWTTTSARMPEGPNTRTLSFSSSALRPVFLASQQTTRRTASCHKLVRYASFMQEIAWFPKRSTTFTYAGQS